VKNEAETRSDHIDPMLVAAGWGVTPGSRIRREYPITLGRLEGNGKRGKALSADYVLEYRHTKLAVVEAKAWDKPLTAGWRRPRITPPSWPFALPTPVMAKPFMPSTWRRGRRVKP